MSLRLLTVANPQQVPSLQASNSQIAKSQASPRHRQGRHAQICDRLEVASATGCNVSNHMRLYSPIQYDASNLSGKSACPSHPKPVFGIVGSKLSLFTCLSVLLAVTPQLFTTNIHPNPPISIHHGNHPLPATLPTASPSYMGVRLRKNHHTIRQLLVPPCGDATVTGLGKPTG